MLLESSEEFCVEIANVLHVFFIVGTDNNSFFLHKPVWKTSEIPFSTDIWTWTKNDVKTDFCGEFNPMFDISNSFEVELTFLWFVKVPGNICLDDVATTVAHLLEVQFPVTWMLTEIVERTGNILEWFTIHLEFISNDFEGSFCKTQYCKDRDKSDHVIL
ncbi:hypothetical protein TRFO_03467 [Tritrichomonas foetus]|uniref:Uncharacterized protein n=1 Tax=Tritrichomonas foetus TaxID=1144522 RepID=A0A1J4KP32_9EUKA|nr:hypothetical protein TRFO_03467 [Tritrichomonas foetus]|eukprot:OHT13047.1 hypothetical protein TRFO_03467 [Tritrichomonas foetus]